MSRSTTIFLICLVIAAAGLAALMRPTPWFGHPAPTVNATTADGHELAPDIITDFGGPPNQEIALDAYTNLTRYAKEYPQLRPMIRAALADGVVTWGEYSKIDKAEQPLATARGVVVYHDEAAPYRQKLAAAAVGGGQ